MINIKTLYALLFKFIMTFVAAWIAFMILNTNPLGWVVTVAIAGTILNYLLGDLFVLPKFGNITASLGDGVLAALTAYIVDQITPVFHTSITSLLVFGIIVAVGEYFFHQYLQKSEEVAP